MRRRGMEWGWLAVLLSLARVESKTVVCHKSANSFIRSCYKGDVRPCTGGLYKSLENPRACARTYYSDQSDEKPTFLAGTLKLHSCGLREREGCADRDVPSLFDNRSVLDQAILVLDSACFVGVDDLSSLNYLCAPTKNQEKISYTHPVTGKSSKQVYASTTCICSGFTNCNEDPMKAMHTHKWQPEFSQFFENSSEKDAIAAIIAQLRPVEWAIRSKMFSPSIEYSANDTPNNTGSACPIGVSLEVTNCFIEEVRKADFLTAAVQSMVSRWQRWQRKNHHNGGCLVAPWCWDLQGEILSNISGVEYRLDLKLSACASLLKDRGTHWLFLAWEDVKEQVWEPCGRLLSSQQSLSLEIDYQQTTVEPLKIGLLGLSFRPAEKLSLTCYRTQELPSAPPSTTEPTAPPPTPEPAEATDLNELKRLLWIALAVWLLTVALAGLLLPSAVLKTEKTDEYLHDYRRTMNLHLIPLLQYNAMPDNLVESVLDHNSLEEAADDYEKTRDMIHDHQRYSTYNFFGWPTGFDYRPFPCIGKPPAGAEEPKCDCPECKHVPRINLTKLIRPTRLIQMGLRDRALVDRKDPLYDTFLALQTDECLPRDAKGSGSGSGEASGNKGSGNLLSASPKLVDRRRRRSDRSTQSPKSPLTSDKNTLPPPKVSARKATD